MHCEPMGRSSWSKGCTTGSTKPWNTEERDQARIISIISCMRTSSGSHLLNV